MPRSESHFLSPLATREVWIPVWLFFSVLLFVPPVMSLVMPPEQINGLVDAVTPPHPECPLCGMTRGFIAMAQGEWAAARAWNGGAPVLFILGLINGCVALGYMIALLRRKWRGRGA